MREGMFSCHFHVIWSKKLTTQVVELEMKLNEISEQYKVVAKSANSKAQQRRLEALEYNLERLSGVQQQVSPFFHHTQCYTKVVVGRTESVDEEGTQCYRTTNHR
jgi:hypothetical protein